MSFRVTVQPTPAQIEEATAPIRAALAAVRMPPVSDGIYRITVTNGEDTYLTTPDDVTKQVRSYMKDVDYGPTRGTEIDVYRKRDGGTWKHEWRQVNEGRGSWGTWRHPDTDWI